MLHFNRFSRDISFLLAILLGLAGLPAAFAEDGTTTEATLGKLKQTLGYLASDELKGRGIGTEGLQEASEFLAKQFQQMGLKTDLVDGTPFQPFEVNIASEMGPAEKNTLQLVSGDTVKKLVLGTDFTPLSVGGSSKFDAPLVFVGYGISAKKLDYDEYDGLDVKGKIVLIVRKEPQQNNPHSVFDGTGASQHALFSRKISNAYQEGAAGVILINDSYGLAEEREQVQSAFDTAVSDLMKRNAEYGKKETHSNDEVIQYAKDVASLSTKIAEYGEQLEAGTDKLIPMTGAGNETSRPEFPVMFAKRSDFEPLIEKQFGKTLAEIETEIDKTLKPIVGELKGWKAVGETDVIRTKATIRNVIGLIEAPNATSDEVIVIGAHYDHLGMGGSGSLAPLTHEIHNGADDNASGTTALLTVTQRLVAQKDQLRHRVLVIAFTGEEEGLLGSAHYVKEPVIPLDKTLMMFNMDMVGRLNENKLICMGSGTAKMFEPLLAKINEKYDFSLTMDPGGFGPSDHASFYAKQLPVLALFTGTHNDYHRPSDDADKINYEGMARIIDYAVDFLLAVDKADDRPLYVQVEEKRPEMRGGSRPYFGSIPDFAQVGKGYGIQGVSPGSPAADAGLQGGDIMIDLGGNRIGGLEDFDAALRKFKGGDKVEVTVLREGKEVKLTVTLAPPR
ncbi:M28 family peptidase [Blastopirellula marina]|uniref:Aminopeptidase n=1 Tax=Blastopirellula marina TaxID=124 RepID=A0A2S8G183_9BACT|nr:M28 family peptidase [Blastopirellula marina]PQO38202.1 aminopeptidase [Blastopirellula marina]PTL44858.1 PDZ domain-containing protein [Blastopirellula marina]